MNITDAEAGLLQKAPVAIFMLVAGADGRRSAEERNAFMLTWREQVDADKYSPLSADPREEQVWQWLFTADTTLYETMANEEDEALWTIVARTGNIIRRLTSTNDAANIDAIVRALIALARAVAYAPTFTLLGSAFGRDISEDEGRIIQRIVRSLRVERCAVA